MDTTAGVRRGFLSPASRTIQQTNLQLLDIQVVFVRGCDEVPHLCNWYSIRSNSRDSMQDSEPDLHGQMAIFFERDYCLGAPLKV